MKQLDNEWILLIFKAKQLGLTVEEIQKFLKLNQKEK
ncbi:DNA-binding anti-repressor SinI [Niallia sp. RD1]|nr:DNA-binding anti-repressor SinI [Niallia sp. RD1]UTI42444.1 anti-repressor SinI family protein [Niallia sp. RD1]